MSVAVRGSLFFVTNLAFGVTTATRAWLVDTAFRIPLVGVSGAIDQAFTDAEPVWAASAVAMVVVPLLSRAIFVVDKGGVLVGVISPLDVLRAML